MAYSKDEKGREYFCPLGFEQCIGIRHTNAERGIYKNFFGIINFHTREQIYVFLNDVSKKFETSFRVPILMFNIYLESSCGLNVNIEL